MKLQLAAFALLVSSNAAFAGAVDPEDKIGTNGAFESYLGGNGVRNTRNPDVRFGNGALSIPGDAQSNDNSAIVDRGNNTDLVKPPSRN